MKQAPLPSAPPAHPASAVGTAGGLAGQGRRGWTDDLISLAVIAAVAAALIGLVTWQFQASTRDNEALIDRRASERAVALSALLRDAIHASLLQVDALHDAARMITRQRLAGDTASERELHEDFDPLPGAGNPDVAQISGVGADGFLLWSTLAWEPPRTDLRDRAFYEVFAHGPGSGDYYTLPVIGRTSQQLVIQIARPIRDPGGALQAISVVSLRANMLQRLCAELSLTTEDAVTLVRADGAVLMRRDMTHLGEIVPDWSPQSDAAQDGQLIRPQVSRIDGQMRYVSTRQIPGQPLYVRVALSKPAQVAALAWVGETARRGTLFFALAVMILAVAGGVVVIVRRRSMATGIRAAQVAESEARYRDVFENLPDGIVVLQGVEQQKPLIAYVNAAALRILGRKIDETVGQNWFDFIYPGDLNTVRGRIDTASSGKHLPLAEYRIVRADGQVRWLRLSSAVMPDPSDTTRLRVIGGIRDITETREQAAALAEAQAHTGRILKVVPGAFYELQAAPSEALQRVFASESAADLFDLPFEDVAKPGFLTAHSGIDVYAMREAALAASGPGGVATIEYPLTLGSRRMWLRDTMRLIPRTDGSRQVVGFVSDMTAEHAADEARLLAERELQRRNWALAAFSRSISILIRSGSVDELVARVCEVIVEEQVYILAAVGLPSDAPGKPVHLKATAGPATGYAEQLALSWSEDVPEGRGPTGRAVRDGVPHIVDDTETDPLYAHWRDLGRKFGIRSSLTVPSFASGRTVGVLIVYASQPHAFGPDELAVFQRLSDEIGFAIELAGERAKFKEAEAARLAAEENLRAAVQLGPGVLYRARVAETGIEIRNVYGDAARVTGNLAVMGGGPASLADLLGAPDALPALLDQSDTVTQTGDYALGASDGTTRWLRNVTRVAARSDTGLEVVGYLSEVTREKQEQLHHQQVTTLLTLGEMATGMAHELNQPLASISFAAQNVGMMLARDQLDLPAVASKVQKIVGEAHRASQLVEHMRVFARNERQSLRPTGWHAVLQSSLEILRSKLKGCDVRDLVPDSLPPVLGASIPMEQVLINLIANAVDAYESAGVSLGRSVTVWGGTDGGDVLLRVSDHAGGVPAHVLPRLFEPFFTTKPPGKGTGLGLALVFGTVTELGGTISASNHDGGAVFEIRLPAAGLPVRDAAA